jgi:tetratricopeptide (TPR) repeat protein
LKLLAYFDNQSFWYELFRAGVTDDSRKFLCELMSDDVNFALVMKTLTDFCFVEVEKATEQKETAYWSMHNCVHDWTLAALNETIDGEQQLYAFDCVAASINWNDRNSFGNLSYGRLAAHAARLVQASFRQCHLIEELSRSRLGPALSIAQLLASQIQLEAAEWMYVRALARSEKELGLYDALTLHMANGLGILYSRQSKLEDAEQMLKRALDGRKEKLGPKHTLTLQSVNNLGILYRNQGKLAQAENMFEQVLAGSVEAMDTVDTLTLVNNLGVLYWNQGKLEEAEQMLNS